MSIDLGRFHRAFFEESFEGVDLMERELLRLDAGGGEAVHAVFRAAHSIKGGAATFGFAAVASFTHHLETLLDQMRSGVRQPTPAVVDVLLRAVDALRNLLGAARDGTPLDTDLVAAVRQELERLLSAPQEAATAAEPSAAPAAVQPAVSPPPEPAPAATHNRYRIRFAPKPELFRSGNDPLLILRELASLGGLQSELDLSALPSLEECDPESCYLAWTLRLETERSRAEVADLFAWVEGDCELSIEDDEVAGLAVADVPAAVPAPAAAVPAAPAPVAPAPVAPVAAAPKLKAAAAAPRATEQHAVGDGGSIRVSTDKIDALINLVGELVITQAMLAQHSSVLDPVQCEKLLAGLQQLDRNTRQLQEAVLSTRMLPIEAVFSRFPRMLRDLAAKLGKEVRLELHGEATELDKSVIEKITDPLTHLVRNALDHGIESCEQRVAAGKSPEGTIRLSAAHQGGHIHIQVSDDGAGLDRDRILAKARSQGMAVSDSMTDQEVWQLIFAPGFSTAEKVTDISGRGVGMDVVKRNIGALGGQIELESTAGKGMRVSIRLPLTLAILDGMSIAVGGEIFIVPLGSVVESLQPKPDQLKGVTGQGMVLRVRDEYLPLVPLHALFRISEAVREPQDGIVVVLESEGRKVALLVDSLVGQQQVVIKNLEHNYRRVFGISGATILGDGRVALILDVGGLVRSTVRAAAA
ncbi:MAG: chemotaxis protein CheA [Nevskia sp.]|nr:chemotaxis protein CheA [Nevskia sp.]